LDQSTTTRKQHQTSYLGDGRLIGGRGVIFPDAGGLGPYVTRLSALGWTAQIDPPTKFGRIIDDYTA
jgi:hypothetical protein